MFAKLLHERLCSLAAAAQQCSDTQCCPVHGSVQAAWQDCPWRLSFHMSAPIELNVYWSACEILRQLLVLLCCLCKTMHDAIEYCIPSALQMRSVHIAACHAYTGLACLVCTEPSTPLTLSNIRLYLFTFILFSEVFRMFHSTWSYTVQAVSVNVFASLHCKECCLCRRAASALLPCAGGPQGSPLPEHICSSGEHCAPHCSRQQQQCQPR